MRISGQIRFLPYLQRLFHTRGHKLAIGNWRFVNIFFTLLAILFVLFVYGAIPFFMLPSTGIVGWAMGFSQSLANGELFDFYARDFGIPKAAAMAFGLAGAWPAGLLIRTGLNAADAYAAIAALWLMLAMFSAYKFAIRFGGTKLIALLGAVTWMTMPIIWRHAGYSFLSLGIALLPFYFLFAFKLFLIESKNTNIAPVTIALYGIATMISVFMDGYTFMMFATGASILLLFSLVTRPDIRSKLLKISVPVHLGSFALAAFAYTRYVGESNSKSGLDFFRGWGLDLSFLAIPTKGVLWLPDLLGFSVERSDQIFFGDASTYVTTFALPILLFGLIAWFRLRHRIKISTGILLVSIFGFYMALGPSLKINSTKPPFFQLDQVRSMGSEFAIAPTGNGWISEMLPGFDAMRASFRWSALGIFALWLLVVIFISSANKRFQMILLSCLIGLLMFNLPNFETKLNNGTNNRTMFQQIDNDLIPKLRQNIEPNETVAFLPWGNDFFANYMAPKAGFRTLNVGGDKNLEIAKAAWPNAMLSLENKIDENGAKTTLNMLVDGTADVIVFPYFDMLWSIHFWPCKLNGSTPEFLCPADRRAEFEPIITELRTLPYLEVVETDLFATIRLSPTYSSQTMKRKLERSLFGDLRYPFQMNSKAAQGVNQLLISGWHQLEIGHVWSKPEANLRLPAPEDCANTKCEVNMSFSVFGASSNRPTDVYFKSASTGWEWSDQITVTSGEVQFLKIPLSESRVSQNIKISIPNATSPERLSGSPDGRMLGIALIGLELIKQ